MIEIIHPDIIRGRIRHALFDFDGTLSLIREGWQGVMIPLMVEWLLETPEHESEAELTTVVTEFVTRLTGKQTIYQTIQLAEEIENAAASRSIRWNTSASTSTGCGRASATASRR